MNSKTIRPATPHPHPKITEATVFDRLETFLDWDQDFYPEAEQQFYAVAIAKMLALLDVTPGDLILDAGCGVGTHSIRIAHAGYRVHAIDFSDPALDAGQQRARAAGVAERITFEPGNLLHLTLPDASFSHIFCWGVLIHIPAIEKALDSLVRILKPGGRLALYVTNSTALDFKIEALGRALRGSSHIQVETHPMGKGYWYSERHGSIWVWQVDIAALTTYLAQKGLQRTHRGAGMFSELYTRGPAFLRTPLVRLNTAWFQAALPAHFAEANLLVFEKPRV